MHYRLGCLTRTDLASHCRRPISLTLRHSMSVTSRAHIDHEERTLSEPRQNKIHQVIIGKIEKPSDDVRVIQLGIPYGKTIKACSHFSALQQYHSVLWFAVERPKTRSTSMPCHYSCIHCTPYTKRLANLLYQQYSFFPVNG